MFDLDTAHAVADEERRALGAYRAAQFFDHDEVQRLVGGTLRSAMENHDTQVELDRAIPRHGLQPTAELIASYSPN